MRPGERAAADDRRLAGWLGFVVLFAALAYGANLTSESDEIEEPLFDTAFLVAAGAGLALMIGVALLVAVGTSKRDLFALRRPASWPRAAGYGLLVIVFVLVISAAMTPFLDPGAEQGLLPEAWPPPDYLVFGLNAAAVVVGAPLAEELFFRGAGYSLFERFGSRIAIVVTAAAWAAAHGLVEAFPLIFAFGIGLAMMRRALDSIVPGMIVHAIFNALALLLAATAA